MRLRVRPQKEDFVPKRNGNTAKVAVGFLCGEAFWWVGLFLTFLVGSYSTYMGVAAFLCWVLFLVLIVRRSLKLDIKALDDPNDDPRAKRLIAGRDD
jgi:hypothetical protein